MQHPIHAYQTQIFVYFLQDRFYVPSTDGIRSLKEQGFKLFKETIYDPFHQYARQAILGAIAEERNAQEQDNVIGKEPGKAQEQGHGKKEDKQERRLLKEAVEVQLIASISLLMQFS
jgi:hypothetical protein